MPPEDPIQHPFGDRTELLGAEEEQRPFRPRLRWQDASGPHEQIVDEPMTLGAAKEANVVVTDPAVSRLHLELDPRTDGLWIRHVDGAGEADPHRVEQPARRSPIVLDERSSLRPRRPMPRTTEPRSVGRAAVVVGRKVLGRGGRLRRRLDAARREAKEEESHGAHRAVRSTSRSTPSRRTRARHAAKSTARARSVEKTRVHSARSGSAVASRGAWRRRAQCGLVATARPRAGPAGNHGVGRDPALASSLLHRGAEARR